MFLKLLQCLRYNYYIWLTKILIVDQDIIQIYYNKDIKLFGQDFIDVTQKLTKTLYNPKDII